MNLLTKTKEEEEKLLEIAKAEIEKRAASRLREAKIQLARRNFRDFVLWMNPNYQFSWHNERLIQTLDDFAKGKIQRLMVFMPPRHGKTELGSRLLPAFIFGLSPNKHIIAASYASDLSQRNNRDVQRIIDTPLYQEIFPDTRLNGSNVKTTSRGSYIRTSDMFEIVGHKGAYRSAGVGGSITGMGAAVAIIDDPHKDLAEATSATVKQGIEDWYQSTLYTRLTSDGQVLVIQTRWAEDDLSGRLLKKFKEGDEYADKWEVLSFPAISTEIKIKNDPRSIDGLALWPKQFPLQRLLKIKSAVGSKVWASLYQQEPAPAEGNIVKVSWFKKYKALPEMDYTFASWDFTFKGGTKSDFVVGQVWGVKGVNKYLIDQVRARAGFTEALRMMLDMAQKYKDIREWVVEDKANGSAIIDALKEKIVGIVPYSPKESKEARAAAVAPQIEAGNVFIPDPAFIDANWVNNFLSEWEFFPYGQHDDQVDATTQALLRANNSYAGWLASLESLDEYDSDSERIKELFGFNNNRTSGGFGLDF